MGTLFTQLLLYGGAAAFAAPAAAVVTAFILGKSARPLTSAVAFVVGAALLDIAVAVVLLVLLGDRFGEESDAGAYVDIVLGVIFLAIGVLAVFQHESREKEEAQRKRVERLAVAGLGTMAAAGLVVQIINIDAIAVMSGGLKELAEAALGGVAAAFAVAFLLLVMLIPYYGPALVFLVARARARPMLERMTDWIVAHSRALEMGTGFGFGALFLVKGLLDLLS
jgi:threonine/homoserine/homoserine lactone efflux protein